MTNEWLSEKITYISALKIQMMLKTFIRISSNPVPYPPTKRKTKCLNQS